jgi:hypothetical protein
MNAEDIIQSESFVTKTNMAWFHLYEVPKIVKLIAAESRVMAVTGRGRGNGEKYKAQLC